MTSIGGLTLLSQLTSLELKSPKEFEKDESSIKYRNCSGFVCIMSVVVLGMVTETLTSMIVNTIESFYPNFCSTKFFKQERFVGTVLAVSGLVYSIGTITAGIIHNS